MYIGDSAFYDCSGIYDDGTIEIPASVVRIGDEAFQCNYNSELGLFNIKNPDCVLGKIKKASRWSSLSLFLQ